MKKAADARKCEVCAGYDPAGAPGLRCRVLNGWSGPSFEGTFAGGRCVHYRAAPVRGCRPGRGFRNGRRRTVAACGIKKGV